MSTTFRVAGKAGDFRLLERDYSCQGINPDYAHVANLTDEEAAAILSSRLIHPLYQLDCGGATGDASEYLNLIRHGDGSATLELRLPHLSGRASQTMEVPGLDEFLAHASKQPGGLEALARRCGISFEGP